MYRLQGKEMHGRRQMGKTQPSSFLKQLEALPKIRLGTKQYVRLDDVLKIAKEGIDEKQKDNREERKENPDQAGTDPYKEA